MSPFVLQFVGSLAAILALVWLVRQMGLGAKPTLASEEAVRLAAGEVADGYVPVIISMDRLGRAAIARNQHGEIMLLRPHGGHIAGRILAAGSRAIAGQEGLSVDCGERVFGKVILDIDDPGTWANAINRLSGSDDA